MCNFEQLSTKKKKILHSNATSVFDYTYLLLTYLLEDEIRVVNESSRS